jgi:hypothetical protein
MLRADGRRIALAVALVLALAGGCVGLRGSGSEASDAGASDAVANLPARATDTAPAAALDGPTPRAPVDSPPPTVAPDRVPARGAAIREHRQGTAAERDPAAAADVASGPTHRVATRVVVPALRIDLPVMAQKTAYPACNVAMYLKELRQPGEGGATYLYAHARKGMFLPLLERSRVDDGASLLGKRVEVYTGDNRVFVYRIDEVRRHVRDLRWVHRRSAESLWLQTSEGPRGTVPKLQVGASFVSTGEASHEAAHPKPRPVACG